MGHRGNAFEAPEPDQAALDMLDDEFQPLDLTPFEPDDPATDAGVLAGGSTGFAALAPVAPGAGAEAAEAVAEMPGQLRTAARGCFQIGDDGLDELADNLLAVQADAERTLVFAMARALDRGVIANSSAATPTQWLRVKYPSMEPGQAARIARVAEIIRDPKHPALAGVLDAGIVTVRGMQIAVREAQRVHPLLPRFSWYDMLGYFLAVATRRPAKDLITLADGLVSLRGGDRLPEDENRARTAETLSWWDLPSGLTRIQGDLSAGDAATFTAAIEALAGPRPGTTPNGDTHPPSDALDAWHDTTSDNNNSGSASSDDGDDSDDSSSDYSGSNGTDSENNSDGADNGSGGSSSSGGSSLKGIDWRPVGKRRADALMELIGAAARASSSDAGRSPVKATITLPLSVLIGSLSNAGYATTSFGQVIDAGTARTMACNAQITPMVLGTDSQPVDLGRATRPFASATRAAITRRDQGCSFPGCDRPAPWCEAHHAIPWWVGGLSDKLNGTLLCSRHHHIVHAKGYLPWITNTTVIWDLTPGRMPTQPLEPDDPLIRGPGAPPGYPNTG